jgi:predicted Zn-dependent peptidase
MDLRETKGWSYGVRSSVGLNVQAVPYLINAPVQADKTGESIRALNDQLGSYLGKKGVSGEELTRLVSNNVDALPGRFETSGAVLGAMMTNDLYRRPDNYYELLAGKYRALTQAELNAAMKAAVDPRGITWVVVGDAKQVRPQLDKLGIPIEVIQPR